MLDGDPAPPPQRGTAPQLSAHVCCNQTAGRIKMPLGREVRLSPGHVVLDGDQAPPPRKGAQPPIFSICPLWPNGRPSQLLLSTCRNGRPKNRTTGVPARIMTGYGTEGPQRGIAAQIGWVATLQPSWSLFYSMWRSAILRIALELHEV